MTGKNIKKKLATGVICLAAIAAEAFFWQKYVTTTLYGQARVMPTPTESVSVETEAPTVPETEAWDPREEVWENYENLGIVNDSSSYVDIYELPDSHSVSIGKALPGMGVEMDLSESNATWTKIELDGLAGYVYSQYLITGQEAREVAVNTCDYVVIPQEEQLPCYESSTTDSSVIQPLARGECYAVVEEGNSWVKIMIRAGVEGYVEKSRVTCGYYLEQPIFYERSGEISDVRRDVINEAWKYYGGEYVWGGEVLGEGVDCSGFVLRLYEKYGIFLHRVSIEQAEDGTEVGLAEMQPGDLIFYHGYRDGAITEGVGHVAIYIGGGKIIHAASEEKGICTDNWDYIPYITVRNVAGE